MKKLLFLLVLLAVFGCNQKKSPVVDISNIEVDMQVKRFEQVFYDQNVALNDLKMEYPYLFPAQFQDSVWLNKRKDRDELELFAETEKLYADFNVKEKELSSLFKHITYYFPKFKSPKVVTLLTNIDPDNKVILTDSLLLISLDHYLGEDHVFYGGFPKYIKRNNTPEHLIVDVGNEFAKKIIKPSPDRSFVSRMIQEGKRIKLLEAFLPETPIAEILGFDDGQMIWLNDNEGDIWKYFIENQMIYSNDTELSERFIFDAPFSKFYLANDQDSPGGIGKWFGYLIVSGFLENTDATLLESLNTNNEEIFKKSKYKPKKA
ncbi:gliding motility lipoprotein GldB [Namhaeicola litoreus]|uniref:Gliding motility lipoprotein GldB n=1 Tax=Namhaeicola litoreus TaxID=1052145 RepID=A0ABW3Y1W1_9FLAO